MDAKLSSVPVEVSARHIHLSQADQDTLFGPEYGMKTIKDLSQPGQWAAEEKVRVKGPRGELELRVLGPCRRETQVELARTDCFRLGIEPALRLSGDLEGTPGCEVIGPKGTVNLARGVIVAKRHIHISDQQAEERGLRNGDTRAVRVPGERGAVFEGVIIRTDPSFDLHMHLDTDEGNAVWADMQGTVGEILEI